jgi:hypothetical protein
LVGTENVLKSQQSPDRPGTKNGRVIADQPVRAKEILLTREIDGKDVRLLIVRNGASLNATLDLSGELTSGIVSSRNQPSDG